MNSISKIKRVICILGLSINCVNLKKRRMSERNIIIIMDIYIYRKKEKEKTKAK